MPALPIIDLHTCVQGEGKYAGVPHILVRFSGCNLLCQFKDNICDTPYSSWFPEKGKYTLDDIGQLVKENPHIKHSFITGGEPFLYPKEVKEVIALLKDYGYFTAAETNGTLYEELEFDFITISPKLGNSVPKPGSSISKPDGTPRLVAEKEIQKHNKQRLKPEILHKLIKKYDYQLKFVVQADEDIDEVSGLIKELGVPLTKVYLMPEGITNDQLQVKRRWLIEKCIALGYNYSDRLHILAYGNKRDA